MVKTTKQLNDEANILENIARKERTANAYILADDARELADNARDYADGIRNGWIKNGTD